MRREVRLTGDEAVLSVVSEKNVIPPYGIDGGTNGAGNRFTVVREGEVVEPSPVPGKISGFPLRNGDIVREESSGGGGFGDPLERDPERVARDVRLGYITAGQGERRYGVVLDRGGAVDEAGTKSGRDALRAARVHVSLSPSNEDAFDGPRRRLVLSPRVAGRLEVGEDDLVELRAREGPGVRGWVGIDPDAGEDTVMLGPAGMRLLDAAPGDRVEIRAARRAPPV